MTQVYRDGNRAPFPATRPTTGASTQRVTVGAASTQSAALSKAGLVRLYATTDCFIAVGTSPTAAAPTGAGVNAGGMPLRANVYETIRVKANDLIAVIQASAGGFLYITETE
ncbi:MAG: hypothetical protein IM674_04270 [Brevundimonas sp.]|nr:hypothetical protein [Brevundimonas sp.]